MMTPPRRTHSRITLLPFCSLLLSLVVLWGAAYKMKQYPEHGLAFRVMSPAKLLTERERPASARCLQAVLALAAQKYSALSAACPAPVASLWIQFPAAAGQVSPAASAAAGAAELTFFFFRPPPRRSLS